jgi:hypothetical protein
MRAMKPPFAASGKLTLKTVSVMTLMGGRVVYDARLLKSR